ncbi:hypothetical protein T10_12084 [Trichinella papuae]|uniref:Uncharacterized protein n=1 Tax=Trichinella papuae TaxID=268474 RepID=A0A0V1LYZ2_9BILA|nr:hypothetical protein T10_12084 [Trichinella papuae]
MKSQFLEVLFKVESKIYKSNGEIEMSTKLYNRLNYASIANTDLPVVRLKRRNGILKKAHDILVVERKIQAVGKISNDQ